MLDYSGQLNGPQWLTCRVQYLDDTDPFSSTNLPEPSKPPSYTFNVGLPLCEQLASVHRLLKAPHKIDDCTLQIFHTGAYLDLDLSITDQMEEFETIFSNGKRNSIILRTSLSVRVHFCIEKLRNSKGREQRRALFALKQIFQDDKDLVPEFVLSEGLACLIEVGAGADQNRQNYVMRALGQIMLYVDGMNGVIEHKDTVRWFYLLLGSQFRLVVKSALKLLLVFVEYTEKNASLLVDAVQHVDGKLRRKPWTNIMKVLDQKDGIDCELLVYAMTLINKTLSNTLLQDTFYDITDSLEALGMEGITRRHLEKRGNDLDLVEQFKIYELSLKTEDGEEEESANSSTPGLGLKGNRERAKSDVEQDSIRQHSANSSQELGRTSSTKLAPSSCASTLPLNENDVTVPAVENQSTVSKNSKLNNRSQRQELLRQHLHQPKKVHASDAPMLTSPPMIPPYSHVGQTTSPKPWLTRKSMANDQTNHVALYNSAVMADTKHRERRRQDRDRRRAEFLNMQNEERSSMDETLNGEIRHLQIRGELPSSPPTLPPRTSSHKVFEVENQRRSIKKEAGDLVRDFETIDKSPDSWASGEDNQMQPKIEIRNNLQAEHVEIPQIITRTKTDLFIDQPGFLTTAAGGDVISTNQKVITEMWHANQVVISKQESNDGSMGSNAMPKEEASVRDMETPTTNNNESEMPSISLAKAEIEKMLAGIPTMPRQLDQPQPQKVESEDSPETSTVATAPKRDSDLMWEKLLQQSSEHLLTISEFNFTDLTEKDDIDIIKRCQTPLSSALPPPLPSGMIPAAPAPPPMPPPIPPSCCLTPSWSVDSQQNSKQLKTIRLFWKEVKTKNSPYPSIWESIDDVKINEDNLQHLFELQTNDLAKKHQTDKRGEMTVLGTKRSNAINIGLTVLPQSRTIKLAILNMDEFTLNKEQIEKILAMLPTEEETESIQDAMQENPDVPLGSAEQFLLTLSSINELQARLQLWSFKLDYEVQEKEIAEPLVDLRDGMEQLKTNETFKCILAVLKSVGNFLNNSQAKGFDILYLAKVPEVKDTVHKQSLLQHVTQLVIEHFPNTTDFYSEIGSVTRASKCDFVHLKETLVSLETRCKASWDHLKTISKHEMKTALRNKTSDFLWNAAQRILTLDIVLRRLMNRFHETLVFFGMSPKVAVDTSPSSFCRIISEFALEYRTLKERIITQRDKKQKRGERNKTRGKRITETGKFSQTEEQIKQKQMETALCRADGTNVETRRRQRMRTAVAKDESHAVNCESECSTRKKSVDEYSDEGLMDGLAKTVTQNPVERQAHRRRRLRNSNRKSLRRTLKNGLTEEEKAAIISKI